MPRFYNGSLQPNARHLRKAMTPWERKLWYLFLRTYPVRYYRQRIIGDSIVDFCCPGAKLIIELDGSQHFAPDVLETDSARSSVLESRGYSILRFPNIEIDRHFAVVCETIDRETRKRIHQS